MDFSNRILEDFPTSKSYEITVTAVFFLMGWLLSQYDFNLFHFLIEILYTLFFLNIFLIGWYARRQLRFNYLFFISVLMGCVGIVDLLHILTYQDTHLFQKFTNNESTQLWISARYIESMGLAWAFLFGINRVFDNKNIVIIPLLTFVCVFTIYPLGVFPDTTFSGNLHTNFKNVSEVIIGMFLLLALLGMFARIKYSLEGQKRKLVTAVILMIAAQFCFSQYGEVYKHSYETGHVLKLLSLFYLYQGMIENKILNRYRLLNRLNVQPMLAAIAISLSFFSLAYLIYDHEHSMHIEDNQRNAQQQLTEVASRLSMAMNQRLDLTKSLRAFVRFNKDFSHQDFMLFAGSLHQPNDGILSLQLAPGGVVRYVTRLEDNRKAIGHDLLGDKKRKELAMKAIQQQKFIIVGPVNLIQGGRAIIARLPVYYPEAPKSIESFWGFATVLIDIEVLLSDAEIFAVFNQYNIAIRGQHGKGAKGAVFYGDESVFISPLALQTIQLPTGSWQIASVNKDSFEYPGFILSAWYWLTILLLAILLAMGSYSVLNRPYILRTEIKRATEELRQEIKQRVKVEQKLRFMAEHDPLTGLPNRVLFQALAVSAIKLAKRNQSNLAVYYLDVDGFKPVNDKYGHDVGDELLREIAQRLTASVRDSDIVARVGGDEFQILLRDSDGAQVNVAENIINAVARPFEIRNHRIVVGISIGIARFPANSEDIRELFQVADKAMYKAKKKGKNNYQIAPQ